MLLCTEPCPRGTPIAPYRCHSTTRTGGREGGSFSPEHAHLLRSTRRYYLVLRRLSNSREPTGEIPKLPMIHTYDTSPTCRTSRYSLPRHCTSMGRGRYSRRDVKTVGVWPGVGFSVFFVPASSSLGHGVRGGAGLEWRNPGLSHCCNRAIYEYG